MRPTSPTSRNFHYKPVLEPLEERCTPAVYTWDGLSDGVN